MAGWLPPRTFWSGVCEEDHVLLGVSVSDSPRAARPSNMPCFALCMIPQDRAVCNHFAHKDFMKQACGEERLDG